MSNLRLFIIPVIAGFLINSFLIFRGYKMYKESFSNEGSDDTYQKARRTTGLFMMSVGVIAVIISCCIYSLMLSQQ